LAVHERVLLHQFAAAYARLGLVDYADQLDTVAETIPTSRRGEFVATAWSWWTIAHDVPWGVA
jgi:hypothetical protein